MSVLVLYLECIVCVLFQVHCIYIYFHLALVLQYVTMHTKWCFRDWKHFNVPARSSSKRLIKKKKRKKKKERKKKE